MAGGRSRGQAAARADCSGKAGIVAGCGWIPAGSGWEGEENWKDRIRTRRRVNEEVWDIS